MLSKEECKNYDERQIRERGFIFKLAFLLLVGFNVITAVLSEVTTFWDAHFSLFESNLVSIMLATAVCSVLMMVKNAYISPKNPQLTNVSMGILSFCAVQGLISNLLSFDLFNTIVIACVFVICCTYWVKLIIDSKKRPTDDEE
jgi:hypothetical protein